jgi:hypothetical protein
LAYVLEKKVIYQYGRDCPRCINHEYWWFMCVRERIIFAFFYYW